MEQNKNNKEGENMQQTIKDIKTYLIMCFVFFITFSIYIMFNFIVSYSTPARYPIRWIIGSVLFIIIFSFFISLISKTKVILNNFDLWFEIKKIKYFFNKKFRIKL